MKSCLARNAEEAGSRERVWIVEPKQKTNDGTQDQRSKNSKGRLAQSEWREIRGKIEKLSRFLEWMRSGDSWQSDWTINVDQQMKHQTEKIQRMTKVVCFVQYEIRADAIFHLITSNNSYSTP